MANDIVIHVKARDETGTVFTDTETKARGLGHALGGVAMVAGGLVLGAGLLALPGLLRNSVSAASSLEESGSKVQVVFGDSAGIIERFGSTSARSLGISKQAALEASGTFGNLFTAMGLSPPVAADMSVKMVTLASDLASFNNIGTDVALEKIRAGLVGEIEPLRALGVNFDAADVKARALTMGLADAHGELDEGDLVMARYSLIMEQTKNAQGDFGRTSDELANKQRIMKAEFANISAELGTALIPILLTLSGVLLQISGWASQHPTQMKIALVALGVAAGVAFTAWAIAATSAAVATIAAAAPIIMIVGGIALLVAALVILERETGIFSAAWNQLRQWLEDARPVIDFLKDAFNTVLPIALGIAKTAVEDVSRVINDIITVIGSVIALITALAAGDWSLAWTELKTVAEGVLNLFLSWLQIGFLDEIFALIVGAIPTMMEKGQELFQGLIDGVLDKWDNALKLWFIDLPMLIFDTIGDVAATLAPKGLDLIVGLLSGIAEKFWGEVHPFFTGLPGGIAGFIGDTARTLYSQGYSLISGLLAGIGEVFWNQVLPFFTGLPGGIVGFVGDTTATLKDKGIQLISGLLNGIGQVFWLDVFNFFTGLPGAVAGAIGDVTRTLFNKGKQLIQGFIDGMLSVPIPNPLDLVPDLPSLPNISIPRWHTGGVVPGPSGAEQLAIVQSGETIIPAGHSVGGTVGGGNIIININALDGESVRRVAPELAREIQLHLRGTGAAGLVA